MNSDSKTRLITVAEIGVLIAILVVGVLIGWYLSGRSPKTDTPTNQANMTEGGGTTSGTVAPVDDSVRVPEAGETPSGDIAVPEIVTAAAPGVEAKARTFAVNINGNTFSPSTIAARVGDTISVNFTAQDKDYDFTQPDLGLSAKILKGNTQLIQVSPTATGKFTFYCAMCGGPESGPVGYLVVAPK